VEREDFLNIGMSRWDLIQNGGVKEVFATDHLCEGGDQVLRDRTFDHVAASACFERLPRHLAIVVLAENQNLTIGEHAANLPSSFETIKPRHAHVHHDQVGLQLASFFQGVLTVNSFSAIS
jgi:hypothetical protein